MKGNYWWNNTKVTKDIIRRYASNIASQGNEVKMKMETYRDLDDIPAKRLVVYVNGRRVGSAGLARKNKVVCTLYDIREIMSMLESFMVATA